LLEAVVEEDSNLQLLDAHLQLLHSKHQLFDFEIKAARRTGIIVMKIKFFV
jgi:hypothetical protein